MKEEIKNKVSEILKKKQESKEFKDTDIVNYTKKYKRNYDIVNSNNLTEIEEDPINAYKQVEKSKVWVEYDIQEQKEKGYSSGATYLKVKCRESLSSRPFDSKDARNVYVTNIERLKIILDGCFTAKSTEEEIYKFIRNKDFFIGDVSDIDVKSWQYSRKVDKKLDSIFGVRFLNFCKRNSDSAISDYKKAELLDPYTKEQQDEFLVKELSRLNERLITANDELENAEKSNKETIIRFLVERYNHVYKNEKAARESIEGRDYDDVKQLYLAKFKYQVQALNEAIENCNKRENLKEKNIVRNDNWDWAFGEKKEVERKKSNAPKINTKLPLSHITRTGGFEIPSIEVDSVTKTFGFNNVVFGNALKDIESREHIKHFLGAITDLAEMLNIDIYAVNQMGKLDMNFATMGTGGHMATYFPSYKAINLTKKSGDGSVAHEWFHYFDNIVQEGDLRTSSSRLASETCLISDKGTKLAIWSLVNYILHGDGSNNQITVRFEAQNKVSYHAYSDTLDGCIAEIQKRYKLYSYSFNDSSVIKYYGYLAHKFGKEYIDVPMTLKSSIYYYNSSRIGSKYWIEPAELCARAFESYIEAVLDLKDRKNNYLVSYKNNWIFTPQEQIPYPQGEELQKIIVLFDNIFKAFKQEYNISDFKPFSEERVSEYVEIKENLKKDINTKKDKDMPIMERLPQNIEVQIKKEYKWIFSDSDSILSDISEIENFPKYMFNLDNAEFTFESEEDRNKAIELVGEYQSKRDDEKDYQKAILKLKDLYSQYKLDKNNKEIAYQLYGVFGNYAVNYLSKGNFKDINLFFEVNEELPKKHKIFLDLNSVDFTDFGNSLIKSNTNIWNLIPSNYKKVAPIKKVNFNISKDDEKLLSIFRPFVLDRNEFNTRLAMEGIHFDEFGVCATNSHIMLFAPLKHDIKGTYCATKQCFKDSYDTQPLEDLTIDKVKIKYPSYQAVIPANKQSVDINGYSLLTFIEAIENSKFYNEQMTLIILKLGEEEFGFKYNFLKECIEGLMKLGYSELTISFSSPERIVSITPKGMYDEYKIKSLQIPFALIMPMIRDTKSNFYFDCNNESFVQKGLDPISLNPNIIKEQQLEQKEKHLESLIEKTNDKLQELDEIKNILLENQRRKDAISYEESLSILGNYKDVLSKEETIEGLDLKYKEIANELSHNDLPVQLQNELAEYVEDLEFKIKSKKQEIEQPIIEKEEPKQSKVEQLTRKVDAFKLLAKIQRNEDKKALLERKVKAFELLLKIAIKKENN